jgi:hypothetical protein
MRALSTEELRRREADGRERVRELVARAPAVPVGDREALLAEGERAVRVVQQAQAELARRQRFVEQAAPRGARTVEAVDAEARRVQAALERAQGNAELTTVGWLRGRLASLLGERSALDAEQREAVRRAEERAGLLAREAERERAARQARGLTPRPVPTWEGPDPALLSVLACSDLQHLLRGSLPAGTPLEDEFGNVVPAEQVQAYLAGGRRFSPFVSLAQVGVLVWALALIASRDDGSGRVTFNPKEPGLRPPEHGSLQQDLAVLAARGFLTFRAEQRERWTVGLGKRAVSAHERFVERFERRA